MHASFSFPQLTTTILALLAAAVHTTTGHPRSVNPEERHSQKYPLRGFDVGPINANGSCRTYYDYLDIFTLGKNLSDIVPDLDFNAIRLSTSIQCGTISSPTEAFKAALDSNVLIAVGLEASAGDDIFINELKALKNAMSIFGPDFVNKVTMINVGSYDLLRDSQYGKGANAGNGANATVIVNYVEALRNMIDETILASTPVGHVEEWFIWKLPEANPGEVISAIDVVGSHFFPSAVDPTNQDPDLVNNSTDFFWDALKQIDEVIPAGKSGFITAMGLPTHNLSNAYSDEAFLPNAKIYWNDVICPILGARDFFYSSLVDDKPPLPLDLTSGLVSPSDFKPKFNLTCAWG
ncbi:hypothetical protein F5Y16DRAFT_421963 [Xylariaceae sp. FL0255]|nr:hypothetical protein F5Y16DRAFT_421963 [Xylariaceae sp. FL0255]